MFSESDLPPNFEKKNVIKKGVYEVFDVNTKTNYIAKIYEPVGKGPDVQNECEIYDLLTKDENYWKFVPKIIYKSKGCIVMEKLGPNLSDLLEKCGGKFSLKTVLFIAEQLITILEFLHSKYVLHRDLSLGNILLGSSKSGTKFYLLDFDFSNLYVDENGKHVEFSDRYFGFRGSLPFASLFNHHGMELSRRDDLVSLGYILIFLLNGELPWCKKGEEKNEDDFPNLNTAIAKNTFRRNLREHTELPMEFLDYMEYCQGLPFTETPDYLYLKGLFKNLFLKMGYVDNDFEWEGKEKEVKQ